MKFVILGGAGMMGSGTVRDLLSAQSSGVEEVIVADAYADRLAALEASINDPRLTTCQLDVQDEAAMSTLLDRADLCINAVPTFAGLQMKLFDACFNAHKPYVDFGGMGVMTVKQKAQHERWKSAGLTAVIGLGADPGMSNIICRAVADKLDTVDAINLYWAATLEGEENPVLEPPYAISTVLAEYANPSQQFLDGALREVRPQSGKEWIDLPAPWGRCEFMYTQHSEPLTVPFAEGISEKGIREMTWKLHLPSAENDAWIGLVKAGFGDFDEPVELRDGTQVKPIDVLEAVVFRNIEKNTHRIPKQASHEIHFAIGRGKLNGRDTKVTTRIMAHPHPLYDSYVDAATSMCLSIGVQQMLKGDMRPGVWGPEEYFNIPDYFSELRKRHFTIESETTILERY